MYSLVAEKRPTRVPQGLAIAEVSVLREHKQEVGIGLFTKISEYNKMYVGRIRMAFGVLNKITFQPDFRPRLYIKAAHGPGGTLIKKTN